MGVEWLRDKAFGSDASGLCSLHDLVTTDFKTENWSELLNGMKYDRR